MRGHGTVVVADVASDPRLKEGVRRNWPAAIVALAVVKDGRVAYIFGVHGAHPRSWSPDEVALIEEVAERTWAAAERARAEAALRASEARFRLMADASPQIVWIIDGEGRVEFFNKQGSDSVGAPDVPPTASAVTESHVHPDDQAATMDAFAEARRAGTTFRVEHRIRSAAGEHRWFLVRGEPYRDPESGEIVRWFGASVDIHDRKPDGEALRASEERFRSFAEASPDVLWIVDAQTRRLECLSPAYEKVWREGRERVMADLERWAEAVLPEDSAQAGGALDAALQGRRLAVEYRIRRPDGGVHHIHDTGFPVLGRMGACGAQAGSRRTSPSGGWPSWRGRKARRGCAR